MAKPASPLEEILEKEFDSMLFSGSRSKPGLVTQLGWTLTYHTLRSRGSQSGFPDRVLIHGERVIFAELKREKRVATALSSEQRRWLDGLARAGVEAYLWRPSDLEDIGEILARRWRLVRHGTGYGPMLCLQDKTWTPGSMWIPGVGRYDERVT